MSNESVITKIKALLSKTLENGATVAESETALQMATKLMEKYEITQEMIQQEDDKFFEREFYYNWTVKEMGFITSQIAELFSCKTYHTSASICFFGHKNNTELCEYYFKVILMNLEASLKEFKNTAYYYKLRYDNSNYTITTNYVKGYITQMVMKLDKMIKANKMICSSNQLVVLLEEELENELTKKYPLMKKKCRAPEMNFSLSEAALAGVQKAEKDDLHFGISS